MIQLNEEPLTSTTCANQATPMCNLTTFFCNQSTLQLMIYTITLQPAACLLCIAATLNHIYRRQECQTPKTFGKPDSFVFTLAISRFVYWKDSFAFHFSSHLTNKNKQEFTLTIMELENSRSDASSLYQPLALDLYTVRQLPTDTKEQWPLQFIKQEEKNGKKLNGGSNRGWGSQLVWCWDSPSTFDIRLRRKWESNF